MSTPSWRLNAFSPFINPAPPTHGTHHDRRPSAQSPSISPRWRRGAGDLGVLFCDLLTDLIDACIIPCPRPAPPRFARPRMHAHAGCCASSTLPLFLVTPSGFSTVEKPDGVNKAAADKVSTGSVFRIQGGELREGGLERPLPGQRDIQQKGGVLPRQRSKQGDLLRREDLGLLLRRRRDLLLELRRHGHAR